MITLCYLPQFNQMFINNAPELLNLCCVLNVAWKLPYTLCTKHNLCVHLINLFYDLICFTEFIIQYTYRNVIYIPPRNVYILACNINNSKF